MKREFGKRIDEASLALLYLHGCLREYDQAASNAVEATAISPSKYALGYFVAGLAMEAKGHVTEARAQYTIFLQQSPDSPLAAQARAALQEIHLAAK